MSSPQLPYQSRAIGVAWYNSAKLTAKSAVEDRGIHDRLSCLRQGVADTSSLMHCPTQLRDYAKIKLPIQVQYLLEEPNVRIWLRRYTP